MRSEEKRCRGDRLARGRGALRRARGVPVNVRALASVSSSRGIQREREREAASSHPAGTDTSHRDSRPPPPTLLPALASGELTVDFIASEKRKNRKEKKKKERQSEVSGQHR